MVKRVWAFLVPWLRHKEKPGIIIYTSVDRTIERNARPKNNRLSYVMRRNGKKVASIDGYFGESTIFCIDTVLGHTNDRHGFSYLSGLYRTLEADLKGQGVSTLLANCCETLAYIAEKRYDFCLRNDLSLDLREQIGFYPCHSIVLEKRLV